MKRFLVSAVIVAGLVLVGCEKKDDSAKDVNQAADKTANQAADSLNKAKSNVNEGASQAKDAAKEGGNAAASNVDATWRPCSRSRRADPSQRGWVRARTSPR